WAPEAHNWDCVDFQSSGTPDPIRDAYQLHRDLFPGKPLLLSEWNSGDQVAPEDRAANDRAVLEALAELVEADPLFLGACYFIWQWFPLESRPHGWDIATDAERIALFRDPPGAPLPNLDAAA